LTPAKTILGNDCWRNRTLDCLNDHVPISDAAMPVELPNVGLRQLPLLVVPSIPALGSAEALPAFRWSELPVALIAALVLHRDELLV
jgi:hypothetical protein